MGAEWWCALDRIDSCACAVWPALPSSRRKTKEGAKKEQVVSLSILTVVVVVLASMSTRDLPRS